MSWRAEGSGEDRLPSGTMRWDRQPGQLPVTLLALSTCTGGARLQQAGSWLEWTCVLLAILPLILGVTLSKTHSLQALISTVICIIGASSMPTLWGSCPELGGGGRVE